MFLSKLLEKHNIKESDITLCNTDFLTSDLRAKRPDVLFSIKTQSGQLYVYILIEHQSYKDPNMPYRMYDYIGGIVGHIIKENPKKSKTKTFKYPQIIPVVFYTGKGTWTIETDIKDKILPAPGYENLIPSVKYIAIELNKLDKRWLLELRTALSKLLYYMTAEDMKEIVKLFDLAMKQLFKEKYELFKRSLKTLMIGNGLSVKEADETVEELSSRKEEREMIRILEKARKEGLINGKREDIYEILEERFGNVPEDIKEAVEKIKSLKKLSLLHRKSISVKDLDEFREILK